MVKQVQALVTSKKYPPTKEHRVKAKAKWSAKRANLQLVGFFFQEGNATAKRSDCPFECENIAGLF